MALTDEFGAILRQARRLKGLQQVDLAELVPFRQSYVSQIERGRAIRAGLVTVEQLAIALDCLPLLVLLPQSPPLLESDPDSVAAVLKSLERAVDRLNDAIALLQGTRQTPTNRRRRKRSV